MSVVVSVNVGQPREAAWAEIGRTSIRKRALAGPVTVRRLGLAGDQVADTRTTAGSTRPSTPSRGRTSTGGPSGSGSRSPTASSART